MAPGPPSHPFAPSAPSWHSNPRNEDEEQSPRSAKPQWKPRSWQFSTKPPRVPPEFQDVAKDSGMAKHPSQATPPQSPDLSRQSIRGMPARLEQTLQQHDCPQPPR